MNARAAVHVRQVLLVLAGVLGMYLLQNWTGQLLSGVVAAGHYDLFIWLDRLVFFLWGVLTGALLMRLLTWRLRWLAVLALPVLILLIVPNVAYLRVRALFQYEISYIGMWPYYVYLGAPVLGMIVGGLFAARRR
jgi:hypothetical protein